LLSLRVSHGCGVVEETPGHSSLPIIRIRFNTLMLEATT